MSLLNFSGDSRLSDYRRFKTPYFNIKIGPEGKELIELPLQIHRLVQKIEIAEFLNSCRFDVINITFIEGSREPFSKQKGTDTKDLFSLETSSGDNISNATGMLADLIFSDLGGGKIGISSIDALTGSAQSAISSVSLPLATVDPVKKIRYNEVALLGKVPEFVFSEKNVVEVIWGYVEDPISWRRVVGKIGIIKADFPENGHPTLTITTLPISAYCDQLTPIEAIDFKNELSFPSIPGLPFQISEAEDYSTKAIVEKIASITGSDLIISEKFKGDKLDGGYVRKITSGKSPHQFLIELAKRHHIHYKWILNPANRKPTIVFMKVEEWNRISRINPELLTYKGPNSILKSVSIKVDAGNIIESSLVGIDKKGNIVQVTSGEGKEKLALFAEEAVTPTKPIDENDSNATKQFHKYANSQTTGNSKYTPESDNLDNMEEIANSDAACKKLGTIAIEFSTIGFTKLHPGAIHLQGLGKRYNGHYQAQNISHIIDSNGYICRGVAICEGAGTGGTKPPEATKGDDSKEKPEKEGLFQPEAIIKEKISDAIGTQISTKAADEYAKMIGIA